MVEISYIFSQSMQITYKKSLQAQHSHKIQHLASKQTDNKILFLTRSTHDCTCVQIGKKKETSLVMC